MYKHQQEKSSLILKLLKKKIKHEEKKILSFVNSDKDPYDYLKRYIKETKYKDWFNRNYPNHTIYDAVGLSATDYIKMKRKLTQARKQPKNTMPFALPIYMSMVKTVNLPIVAESMITGNTRKR